MGPVRCCGSDIEIGRNVPISEIKEIANRGGLCSNANALADCSFVLFESLQSALEDPQDLVVVQVRFPSHPQASDKLALAKTIRHPLTTCPTAIASPDFHSSGIA